MMFIFSGKIRESAIKDFMETEGIAIPEGMKRKAPSWYFVILERDPKTDKITGFFPTDPDDPAGQWITTARFLSIERNGEPSDYERRKQARLEREDAEGDNVELPI